MSKAKEIAEERLAKGEISRDEFEKITNKISKEEAKTTKGSRIKYNLAVALVVFGAGLLMLILATGLDSHGPVSLTAYGYYTASVAIVSFLCGIYLLKKS